MERRFGDRLVRLRWRWVSDWSCRARVFCDFVCHSHTVSRRGLDVNCSGGWAGWCCAGLHAKPVETHTKLIQSVLFPHHLALNLLPSHPSHLTQQLLHTVLVLSFQSLCLRVFLFSPFISLWRSLTLMPPAVIAPYLLRRYLSFYFWEKWNWFELIFFFHFNTLEKWIQIATMQQRLWFLGYVNHKIVTTFRNRRYGPWWTANQII